MGGDGELARGREAAARLAWADAYTALSLADRSSSLAAEDLELLATAAYLLGRVEDCLQALRRAQQLHLDLWVDDLTAAHEQAISLGARLLQAADDPEAAEVFQVYADPAGHPFCLGWAAADS